MVASSSGASLFTVSPAGNVSISGTLNAIITPTGFTQGPVVFGGVGGVLNQNNNLFWDNNNSRLGVGTTTPGKN